MSRAGKANFADKGIFNTGDRIISPPNTSPKWLDAPLWKNFGPESRKARDNKQQEENKKDEEDQST